ncbi:extracellular mutant protein 11-domain-containing protein [Talaromyces proteolyticus]|uniref:Extracellular mutant protein 11-domain-containing protein n=1 Tax=Talaromyces proteolyticus TaxID=1131652 RepID=A0AAD4KHD6_9EURO|nr:extracellular mutant protein 11-domain-containing protein [Talaromyces proteolyticus]KAH8691247.1 extracellular mutant protein 11-domain-containing protein [Talaromyces proteolyticus]
MGVGEYIHAKQGDHQDHQRGNSEQLYNLHHQPDKTRPGNGLPYSRFSRPASYLHNNDYDYGYQQDSQESANANYKSVFDTDVEGVDDSTITVTSAAENESVAHGFEVLERQHVAALNWNESVPSESEHSFHPAGDGQDGLNGGNRRRSPVSVVGDEDDADDEVTQTLDWVRYQASQQAPTTATTAAAATASKRNSQGERERATHSRIPRASSRMALNRSDSDPVQLSSHAADEMETKTAYRGANHNYSRSLATTPNNRFNFKTERPYERLIQRQSPTRHASGPRPQPERQSSSKSTGLFKKDLARREQERNYYDSFIDDRVRSTLDATDDEAFEDETGSVNIQFPSSKSRQRSPAQNSSHSDAHPNDRFEADYPNEILQQMQYSDLENESFDHIPIPRPLTPKTNPPTTAAHPQQSPPSSTPSTASDKLSFVLHSLPLPTDRHRYLSSLSLPEWEEFGDEVIGRLGDMLNKIKDARKARRRTTALFEAEIKRRHDDAQDKHAELDQQLSDMKQGGMGVLKGLKPG